MKKNNKLNTPPELLGGAPFFMGPHHPPLPAAKTLHYPLPNDRHLKPKYVILCILDCSTSISSRVHQ